MARRRMTKADAVQEFCKGETMKHIKAQEVQWSGSPTHTTRVRAWRFWKPWMKDPTFRREAWNNWTDSLHKDGQITAAQYNSWSHPYCT